LLRGADADDIIRQLDATLSIFQAIPDYASMAYSKAIVSLCYLAQGDLSTALRVATLTLSLIRERHIRGPFLPYVIGLLADCASAALSAASRGIIMERMDKAAIQSIDGMLSAWGAVTREGEVAMCRWRGVRAWVNAKPRRARRWWQRSLEGAEAMGATHEAAKTCLEMGRWTGERQYLARAEISFEHIGSTRELAQARALLERSAR
jgi:hypothetical protein